MVALTLLPTTWQVNRVRAVGPIVHQVIPTSSTSDALTILRLRPVDVLVVDPVVDQTNGVAPPDVVADVGEEFPYLPIVFYTRDAAKALPLVVRFPTRERCETLVAGIDDDLDTMRRSIESAVGASLAGRIGRRFADLVCDAPPSLCRIVRVLFSSPAHVRTVDDIARGANMSRRNLDRMLEVSGAVTAGDLLDLARAFVAVRRLRDARASGAGTAWAAASVQRNAARAVERATGAEFESLLSASDDAIAEYFGCRLRRNESGRTAWAMRG